MFGRNQVSDKDLLKTIGQKISRTGTSSSSKVTATVRNGTVTISGNIPYEIQRSPIIKAVSRIPGVRNVVDQLRLAAKKVQHPLRPVQSQPAIAANEPQAVGPESDDLELEDVTPPADQ